MGKIKGALRGLFYLHFHDNVDIMNIRKFQSGM